ncbi:MAG: putative DNA-binding domain-containing protein [Alphaproteobacteria bacterium]|nr:putative DNA-binding domain-containing protein [Alphaproteobacteria bacterium]
MTLAAFFDAVGPMVRGQRSAADVEAALGPCPTGTEALGWYATLQAHHVRCQLAELFPTVHAAVARRGPQAWDRLVDAYVGCHPPSHWELARVGEAFADWLVAHDVDGARLGSVADWRWTRWLARTARDTFDGDGLDVRLFVRSWPVDAPRLSRALRDGDEPTAAVPTSVLVWRHEATGRVHHLTPSLATLAVLATRQGLALRGPLADLSADRVADEAARLLRLGALIPDPTPRPPETP